MGKSRQIFNPGDREIPKIPNFSPGNPGEPNLSMIFRPKVRNINILSVFFGLKLLQNIAYKNGIEKHSKNQVFTKFDFTSEELQDFSKDIGFF